jgi:PAS domain S-box-containing protein
MGILDPEKVDKIKGILRWHPRGVTISDLSSEMKVNRNLVAKYLDMLLISGQVEMEVIGAAKVYFLSRRVPISALLEFSSDIVIVIDDDQMIRQVNEQVTELLNLPREALIGKRLADLNNPFISGLFQSEPVRVWRNSGEQTKETGCIIRGNERHFRVKQIPTAFEDGGNGFTFIIEDFTERKKYEAMLRISEAKYRGLVQFSGETIVGYSTDGSITSWNPAAEKVFGYTEEEMLNKPVTNLVPQNKRAELKTIFSKVMAGESVGGYEIKMTGKGGSPVDIALTISPITSENGTIVGASSIARDITGEKMEQYLREHEDQYRTLVEDLNVGIYRSTGDPRGKFIWGNTALLNILGYHSISELQGINVIDMFSAPDGRIELLGELRKHGFVKNHILHLSRADGNPISVCVTALAEFDKDENVVFINGIVQDITGISDQFAFRSGHSP